MVELSLQDFVHEHGQMEAAGMLGLTQGGISRALNNENRKIVVRVIDGKAQAFDVRPFPYKTRNDKEFSNE